MAVSFVGLFVLAGLAALVFLVVLGVVMLLTNPKTREVAKVLLGGLAAMILLGVVVAGLYMGMARHRATTHEAIARQDVARQIEQIEALKAQREAEAARAAATADVSAEPADDEAASTTDEASDAASPEEAVEATEDAVSSGEDSEAAGAESTIEKTKQEDTSESADEEPAELSVAPLADDDRPAWVDRKPYKEGSVYYWPIATDPRPDLDEAEEEALPQALHRAVSDYVTEKMKLGSFAGRRIHLDPELVRSELVGEDIWIEPHSLSVGEFVQLHALVKFDREANTLIREVWAQERLVGRLWSGAGILCMTLLGLALVYCYLKIDQITQGSRRRLLRFAAILVILGLMVVAAGVASVGIA